MHHKVPSLMINPLTQLGEFQTGNALIGIQYTIWRTMFINRRTSSLFGVQGRNKSEFRHMTE